MDIGLSHEPSSGPSPLEVTSHNPANNSTEVGQQSAVSTPVNNELPSSLQSLSTATPAALNEGLRHGFFKDLFGRFSKKRKAMSLTTGEELDTSLNEDITKVAEIVYNLIVSDISCLMNEKVTKFV